MRRQKSQAGIFPRSRAHRKLSHADKLAFISQYKRVPDPTNRRSVETQYRTLKSFPLYLQKPANKAERRTLRQHGFFSTDKGVIIDGPRDSKRKPIASRRFAILGGGIGVKWTVNGRRDYIIGLTSSERKEFVMNPTEFLKAHRQMMKDTYPDFRHARDIQTRLQWGAYQATKDFSVLQFTKRYPFIESPVKGKKIRDRLTGIHYVIHLPRKFRKHGKKKS